VWKAIEKARKLIGRGACLQVAKGRSINVWEDPWFPGLEGLKPTPIHPSLIHKNHNPTYGGLINQSYQQNLEARDIAVVV